MEGEFTRPVDSGQGNPSSDIVAIHRLSTHNLRTKMAKEAKPQNKSAIAERFIAWRRRLGFSQSRLGKMIGICRQSVSKIENEHVLARDSTWHQFCEYAEIHQLSERMAGLPENYWRDASLKMSRQKKATFLL
jgi:DNA-binding XRE family transcriptional regulator